jgi:hypothetical protein
MIKKILKEINGGVKDRDTLEIGKLMKIPSPENKQDMPEFQDFKPNFTHQADLLHLPTAKFGYKFLLVVVDTYSRHFDCEPMKNRDAIDATNAFKKIYTRLPFPKMVEFDQGGEFKKETKHYFEEQGISVRYSSTNRHRMQGLVEARNGIIVKVLFSIMNLKEIKSNKSSSDWYRSEKEFRNVVKLMNDYMKYKPPTEDDIENDPEYQNIRVSDNNRDLLELGTTVLVSLDMPKDIITKKKLIGNFRNSDIRWERIPKKIIWIVLKPNQPPMYRVEGEKILRTRQQLQVIRRPRQKKANNETELE